MERAQGFAQQGAQVVWTAGHSSATQVQETAPFAMILVYLTGTTTLATLFADNNTPPTPLANPFTANDNGYWYFYAADGRYDVMIEAENWTWTIGDILLGDASMYQWTDNVQANGNSLLGASLVQTNCLQLGGTDNAMSICLDANTGNTTFYNPAGNSVATLDPNGNLTLQGCVNAFCYLVQGQNLDQRYMPLGGGTMNGPLTVEGCVDAQCYLLNGQPLSSSVVASLNGLTGDVSLVAGSNVTVVPSGNSLVISAAFPDQMVTSLNGMTGGISILAGANVTVTPSGQSLIISAAAGGSQTPWTQPIDANYQTLSNVGQTSIYDPGDACALTVTGNVCVTGNISSSGSTSTNDLWVGGKLYVPGGEVVPSPTAAWQYYPFQVMADDTTTIIAISTATARYSVFGSWCCLMIAFQFNPQLYGKTNYYIQAPPVQLFQGTGGVAFAADVVESTGNFRVTNAEYIGGPWINLRMAGTTPDVLCQIRISGVAELEV